MIKLITTTVPEPLTLELLMTARDHIASERFSFICAACKQAAPPAIRISVCDAIAEVLTDEGVEIHGSGFDDDYLPAHLESLRYIDGTRDRRLAFLDALIQIRFEQA